MNLQLGEVVLIRMQFHQATAGKVRPAVVLLDARDDDFVAAPVTSQLRDTSSTFSLGIGERQGLNVASSIRIHKLTVLAKIEIVKRLGTLSDADRTALVELLCRTFCREPGRSRGGDRPA